MIPSNCEIRVVENVTQLARAAAEEFVRLAEYNIAAKDSFTVALSGGSTPKTLYALLADESDVFRARVPWSKIHFFWGDERHVPPEHPDSNYRMTHEALLSKAPILSKNIHRISGERTDAHEAALEYEQDLRAFFRLDAGQWPRFDLVLLGMGPDGHTASLFPGTDVLNEQTRLVAAPWVETFNTYRITLTPPVLNHAAYVVFMVSGHEKAETLRMVLDGEYHPNQFPAQMISPLNGRLLWLIDQAAARLLSL